MAFTEFYCNAATGSNVNSGSSESAPVLSLTGGSWASATGVFTKTGQIANVSVGMFGAVRVDGSSVAARIGRITAVDANTVTLSTTAGSGSLANQFGTASLVVEGPHKGPNAAESFPFGFLTIAASNAAGHVPFINLKNNAQYNVTATVTHSSAAVGAGGYTNTVRDGGKFTIDGGTSGASFNLMSVSIDADLQDAIFQNNGATGSAAGLNILGGRNNISRIIARYIRGIGIDDNVTPNKLSWCEAYACNQSNTAGLAGIRIARGCVAYRCISRHNLGSNSSGFLIGDIGTIHIECISHANGQHGFNCVGANSAFIYGCDIYLNGAAGIQAVGIETIINSNLIDNGTYGISGSTWRGLLLNCGFGRGNKVNPSGDIQSAGSYQASNMIAYPNDVTPWVDPDNGDFRINLREAKGTGDGLFTQTAPFGGAIGYPDIGSNQHLEATPSFGRGSSQFRGV